VGSEEEKGRLDRKRFTGVRNDLVNILTEFRVEVKVKRKKRERKNRRSLESDAECDFISTLSNSIMDSKVMCAFFNQTRTQSKEQKERNGK